MEGVRVMENKISRIEYRIMRLEKFVMESKKFEKFVLYSVAFFYAYVGLHVGYWIAGMIFK